MAHKFDLPDDERIYSKRAPSSASVDEKPAKRIYSKVVQIPEFVDLMHACKQAYGLGRSVPCGLTRPTEPHCHRVRTRNSKKLVMKLRKETDYSVPMYDCPARKMIFAAFDIGLSEQQTENERDHDHA